MWSCIRWQNLHQPPWLPNPLSIWAVRHHQLCFSSIFQRLSGTSKGWNFQIHQTPWKRAFTWSLPAPTCTTVSHLGPIFNIFPKASIRSCFSLHFPADLLQISSSFGRLRFQQPSSGLGHLKGQPQGSCHIEITSGTPHRNHSDKTQLAASWSLLCFKVKASLAKSKALEASKFAHCTKHLESKSPVFCSISQPSRCDWNIYPKKNIGVKSWSQKIKVWWCDVFIQTLRIEGS